MKKILLVSLICLLWAGQVQAISVGSRSFVESIQCVTLTISAGSGTNTKGINSVDTTRSVVEYLGSELNTNIGGSTGITLTSSTIVTGRKILIAGVESITTLKVIQFSTGLIKSIQSGTITIANTKTDGFAVLTTPVNVNNSYLYIRGYNEVDLASINNTRPRIWLTNNNVVAAKRNGTNDRSTVFWTVVEFYDWVVQ